LRGERTSASHERGRRRNRRQAPAARPRGWLRATIVGTLALGFVGAASASSPSSRKLRGAKIKPAAMPTASWC
jgi:hypothetical protein